MTVPRKGRRQLASLRAETSVRDRAILRSVAELRLLSARQVERLHFVGGDDDREGAATPLSRARTCRRALERLVRDGLLVRLERRVGGVRAGSASFVYAIGPAGERLIGWAGPRRRHREPSTPFVDHTLAVSELYVRLQEAQRGGELELLGIEAEPQCWRTLANVGGGRSRLKPDLAVSLAAGGYEFRWFVEVDLGTEHRPAVLRKCQTYEAYYRSGVEQAWHGVFPRVLWVTLDNGRAERLREIMAGTPQLTAGLFLVATSGEAVDVLAGGRGRS